MRTGTPAQASLVASAIRNGDASLLPSILEIVETTGGMAYTLACAKNQITSALALLNNIPSNIYTAAMRELAEFSIARNF